MKSNYVGNQNWNEVGNDKMKKVRSGPKNLITFNLARSV